MERKIEFIDLAELERIIAEKESERTILEKTIKEAIAFLNFKHCDIGTFYIDTETYDIYLTPLGYITKKVFRSIPFESRERAVLIKTGKLIPELSDIKICIPIKKERL